MDVQELLTLPQQVKGSDPSSTSQLMLKPGDRLTASVLAVDNGRHALLSFGQFKAYARLPLPVVTGQHIRIEIQQHEGGMRMILQPPVSGGAAPVSPSADNLQIGLFEPVSDSPILRAHAHSKTGEMRSSGPMSAPTAPELAKLGEQIQQLLDRPVSMDQTARIPLPRTAEAALNQLQGMLRPIATTGDTAVLMAGIRDFVENSGFYFEKRVEAVLRRLQARPLPMPIEDMARPPSIHKLMVNDIKPNLLIINEFIEKQILDQKKADRHVLEAMKHMAQRTLAHIEQQQHSAAEKPVDPNLWQPFSHMLLMDDQRGDARLKIYYPKKGRDDDAKKTPRVALLLEMDRLGTVRTDLWMVGSDLNITFFVQTEETQAGIKAARDEIKGALNDSFNTVCVNVVVNVDKIDRFDDEDLGSAPRRLLDLSI